mgnify:CR=1 FL=1
MFPYKATPLNLGHRGAQKVAPENTMAAFERARTMGADGMALPPAGNEDFIDSKAYSVGLQASKNFGMLVPYGGLAYDMSSMTVQYTATSGAEEREVELDMDSESTFHLTLGVGAQLGVVHLNASGELAQRMGFSVGAGIGF